MIENLVKLVQQYAGDAIVNNNAIPNEKNDAAINETAGSIFSSLQGMASGGQLDQVLGMFSKTGVSDDVTQNVQGSVVSSLMSKMGIDNAAAQGIANQLVPTVLGALAKNTNDPSNNDFSINSVLSSVTGGKTDGVDVQGMLNRFAGGDDGKFDMNDVMNFLGKGKSDGASKDDDGGILGTLGSLFK